MGTGLLATNGNSTTLIKVDKLRELIGTRISLPQLVVVGDQSSGKSSVLESITGFAFPRSAELCTRYATQITCRREASESFNVTIMPHNESDPDEAARLMEFSRSSKTSQMDNNELADIFEAANEAMGVNMGRTRSGKVRSGSAFSKHILKIEICGPDQEHFTVIDVPGIFRKETEGVTTENDIALVRRMVKDYMQNHRTIILAIIPANVDPATQEILKLAKQADPTMERTMGVLTKPDLAIERVMQNIAIDHVTGKRCDLVLGYHIVKNRGPDDGESSLADGQEAEEIFFSEHPWSTLKNTGRTGASALKTKVHGLLTDLIKQEFPKLREEIKAKLGELKATLDGLGAPRSDTNAQRAYLGNISDHFQGIVHDALGASYGGRSVFNSDDMRLVTRIVELDEKLSKGIADAGHTRAFSEDHVSKKFRRDSEAPSSDCSSEQSEEESEEYAQPPSRKSLSDIFPCVARLLKEPENPYLVQLQDIFKSTKHQINNADDIRTFIQDTYNNSRGMDLGTFSTALLAAIFQEQTKNWATITSAYVSIAIVLVHRFIHQVMGEVCLDKGVREELEQFLAGEIEQRYMRAKEHAQFLVNIERTQSPFTLNPYFNDALARAQQERVLANIKALFSMDDETWDSHEPNQEFPVSKAALRSLPMSSQSNAESMQQHIHDVLKSYYKVAMKRFADNVCLQAVHHYLLFAEDGPLKVFNSKLVYSMDAEQLEGIAGESAAVRSRRNKLGHDIVTFETALEVLGSRVSMKLRR